MAIKKIDAALLQKAFIAGAYNLEKNKDYINELNVFPVPDGDTGSNMSLTIMAAAKEVIVLDNPTIEDLSKTISTGSLRGARGNSGVILSQLLRGFCKEIKDKKFINSTILADGFTRGVETAYKAVMKPKEGTILTVAKGVAEKAAELAEQKLSIDELAKQVIDYGYEVLAKTPDMLPVLKEAGVVDSGGQGLMEFLKGAYNALVGIEDISDKLQKVSDSSKKSTISTEDIDTSHITFGYCTEFIIMLEKEYNMDTEMKFKEFLSSIGDSLVVVSDDEIVKVHVHTNNPGLAIEKGLEFGQLTNMKIDNMREEHREKVIQEQDKQKAANEQVDDTPCKEYGFVAVSVGEGLNQIFTELGVDYIIEGGQTMNPSTEDVLSAIAKVNANTVFILPNNKNIILAANQAAEIEETKNVVVIPSKTIPQGISAMIGFEAEASVDDNKESMIEALDAVKSGQVTYAVRDTSIDGKEIKNGDYMGIDDTGIKSVGTDIYNVVIELIKEMSGDNSELLSIYYGDDVKEEEANDLLEKLAEEYPDYEVELHPGNQPIYYYIISLE